MRSRSRTRNGGRLLASVISGGSDPVAADLQSKLLFSWHLNEASGNAIATVGGLDLTANNAPTSTTGQVYATARAFNGTNQTFSRTSTAALQMPGSRTIEAWVFPTSTGYRPILTKYADAATTDYGVDYFNLNMRFFIGNGSGSRIVQTAASLNNWHHVLAWYDASAGTISIRVDNGTITTVTPDITPPLTAAVFQIGGRGDNGGFFAGRIGPARIYSGVLSNAAQNYLWNGGAGRQDPFGF